MLCAYKKSFMDRKITVSDVKHSLLSSRWVCFYVNALYLAYRRPIELDLEASLVHSLFTVFCNLVPSRPRRFRKWRHLTSPVKLVGEGSCVEFVTPTFRQCCLPALGKISYRFAVGTSYKILIVYWYIDSYSAVFLLVYRGTSLTYALGFLQCLGLLLCLGLLECLGLLHVPIHRFL